ncbi:LysR family transcriptional regulator [Pelagibaculum spongiae]|uniref:LysR family transcriptional regulator n=1 Tax=Pelagibaculum spongiae TaxID=2080658 RepID=A0A2V1GQ37_9GAMM|nr:LysR family transcriptional regulator [Pelagibaculum spongiae]PVZ65639.1 LysR family transcriptional regulator [Pelagibaculum spongiae]
MDTELLKTFLEVERTRHFGRAAENLYLTQSAVSARVRQLEQLLGIALFERFRHNIQLTHAGEKLKRHAQSILLSWERARQEVGLRNDSGQQIAIGATPNLWDLLMQDDLGELYGDYQELALRAEMQSHEVILRRLMERTLDLGVVFDPPKIDELKTRLLTEINLVMVADHSCSLSDDSWRKRWVSVDWGTQFSLLQAQMPEQFPRPVLHTNNGRIARDFLLTRGGCAYLPQLLVQPMLDLGKLHLVKGAQEISRQAWACWHNSQVNLDLIEHVLSRLKNE